MKFAKDRAMVMFAGIAIGEIVRGAPTTHVTETTTAKEYDTTTTVVVAALVTNTITTQFDNGTVQRTYTQPNPYVSPEHSKSTTVTTDSYNGNVQKRTVTTYTSP
jgi:hypothetical protein